MDKRGTKKPSALNNPKLSKAIDTTLSEGLTAVLGKEFAQIFVPFWKDVLLKQDSEAVQKFLVHMNKMYMSIEASVKQMFRQKGFMEIALTELEVKKAQVFAKQLQNRSNPDIAKYFELLKAVLSETMFEGEPFPTDLNWEDLIEEIQSMALEHANKLSPEQFTGSALGIIRSTATYYMEELASCSESTVSYDPIYALPQGVQPSVVLEGRINQWQSVKSRENCECSNHCKTWNQSWKQLNKCAVVPFTQSQAVALPNQFFAMQWEFHLLQPLSTHSNESNEAAGKICKVIDSFIDKLFSLTTEKSSDKIIDLSLSFVEELMESSLFKLATPFLVTLLHGTVTLTSLCQKKAYQYLVKVLTHLQEREDIQPFDKWFLKATCEYISTQVELTNLPTTVLNLGKYLFRQKTNELVSEAANSVCSKTTESFVLEPLLRAYQSQIGLVPAHHAQRSVIYFLNSLISMKRKDQIDNHLATLMEAAWQYPDLCEAAAKVITSLLPHNYFHLINCTRSLMVPPEEYDTELYQHEKDVEDKVTSKEMSFYDAALWYLDLMVNDQLIHHSHQKVLCLLKAAHYILKALVKSGQDVIPFAFKNAITLLAYDASQLACTCLQPGARNFALATAYRLTCLAADISDPSQHFCLDGRVARGLLGKLTYSSQFTYLLSQPMTLDDFWVAASSYINKVCNLAQQAYIQQLLQIPEGSLPIRSALLHYQNLESCYLRGQVDSPQCNKKRCLSMSNFLSERKWTFDDVSRSMSTALIQRDDEGFMRLQQHLGEHLEIAELKGVVFNYNEDSPSIHIIIKPAKNGDGLLSYRDIIEILQLNPDETSKIVFSLDPPSGTERYHPFMEMRCYPAKLQNTEFMQSLFHADYLLKFLTTGIEVSAKPPFKFKSIEESLIKDLPESLDFLHRPPYKRGVSHMTSHRFWIEVEEVFYDEDITGSHAVYYIDKVKVQVKSRPMVVTLNGNKVDAKHSEYGPHAQFALQLTQKYEEISKYFKIFARVKELSKLQFVVQKCYSHLESLKESSPKSFESFSTEIHNLHSLCPIKTDPDFCLWVPATFNNFVYGGFLCSPKPSHLDYLLRSGADIPESCSGAEAAEYSDVYKFMQSVRGLERVGGLKFEIQFQHKVKISPSVNEFVCIRISEMQLSSCKGSIVHNAQDEDDIVPTSAVVSQPGQLTIFDQSSNSKCVVNNEPLSDDTCLQKTSQLSDNLKERFSEAKYSSQPSQAFLQLAESHSTNVGDQSMDSVYKLKPVPSPHHMSNESDHKSSCVGDKTGQQGTESVGVVAKQVSEGQDNNPDLKTPQHNLTASYYSKSVQAKHDKCTQNENLKLQEPSARHDSSAMNDACLSANVMAGAPSPESAYQSESKNERETTHMSRKKDSLNNDESLVAGKTTISSGYEKKIVEQTKSTKMRGEAGQESCLTDSKSSPDDKTVVCVNESAASGESNTSSGQLLHHDDKQNKDQNIHSVKPQSDDSIGSEVVSESESESGSESKAKSKTESKHESGYEQTIGNPTKMWSPYSVEFDMETVISRAAKHQILFIKRGTRQDTLSNALSKSLINQAIFGKTLNNPEFKGMLMTTFNFNETSFHPNEFACHQIKTAIVLRKIIELHYKHGTEKHIMC